MASLRTPRPRKAAMAALTSLALTACVDPFGGSNIQVTFDMGVYAPGESVDDLEPGQPPPGTHFAFYTVDNVYQRDDMGNLVLDGDGNPIIEASYVFEIQKFEIQPLIDLDSPCFIEKADARFPGLHVTRLLEKLGEETGIVDPMNPPAEATEGDVIDYLTADRRMFNLGDLATQVKAVTSFSTFQYPAPAADCNGGPDLIPPPECIDEESNARRLELCEQLWEENPLHYEGSDKVFTLPLNGIWRGAVTGMNPVNDVGPLGGAKWEVDEVLEGFDGLLVNWQYKDFDGDGEPDYPDGFPEEDKSSIGFHYMSGAPIVKTRGVLNVPMINRAFNSISGEAVIFPDLDDDDVNF